MESIGTVLSYSHVPFGMAFEGTPIQQSIDAAVYQAQTTQWIHMLSSDFSL